MRFRYLDFAIITKCCSLRDSPCCFDRNSSISLFSQFSHHRNMAPKEDIYKQINLIERPSQNTLPSLDPDDLPLNPARPGLIITVAITLGGLAIAIAIAPAARRRFHWPLVIAHRRLFLISCLHASHFHTSTVYTNLSMYFSGGKGSTSWGLCKLGYQPVLHEQTISKNWI